MIIIGLDYHPGFQQIAFVDTDTGEFEERHLEHREEAEKFYRDLAAQGMKVRVGMEASGHARWFERLLSELQLELWIGDAAEIRTKRVGKQKTDRQDAQLILRLMLEDRFRQIWVPSWENRDLRQLLWHRHRISRKGLSPCGSIGTLWRAPIWPSWWRTSQATTPSLPTACMMTFGSKPTCWRYTRKSAVPAASAAPVS